MNLGNNYVFPIVVLFVATAAFSHAESFTVSVNTASIQGQSGFLAFDFLGGSPGQNNVVTIVGFGTNALLGSVSLTGDALGRLVPGPGTLGDSQFFNEILQSETFGTTASFSLSLSTNVAQGGIPDEFSLFALNSSENPYVTSDPTGAGSLLTIDINQASLAPQVFTSSFASVSIVQQTAGVTPEPSGWVLLGTGMLSWFGYRSVLGVRRGTFGRRSTIS